MPNIIKRDQMTNKLYYRLVAEFDYCYDITDEDVLSLDLKQFAKARGVGRKTLAECKELQERLRACKN